MSDIIGAITKPMIALALREIVNDQVSSVELLITAIEAGKSADSGFDYDSMRRAAACMCDAMDALNDSVKPLVADMSEAEEQRGQSDYAIDQLRERIAATA